MRSQQPEKQRLLKPKFSTQEPPSLNIKPRRPYKGITLSFFLFFCGLLFFTHGFHRYQQYTFWDLFAVWLLAFLLIIPGGFFVMITLLIELGNKRLEYSNYPELFY